MSTDSLETLIALSARVGADLDLVQAGGGNTSIKQGDTLWVKASGKWLRHAAEDEMFLSVPMADIERQLAAADEKFPEYRTPNGTALRPSVETAVHAVLPQRVVVHVHSVRTIAWAARENGEVGVAESLDGLRWSWIPYTHPGIPLAIRIREDEVARPDVLILENHGLVVAADTCEEAERLLREVERRLDGTVRTAPKADLARLEELANGTDWEAADSEAHALATSVDSVEISEKGTLFPDQCVYLGPAAAVVREGNSVGDAIERYREQYDFSPVCLLVPGVGVLTKKGMNRAAQELLIGLKRVIERVPGDAVYLPSDQVARLMNWDAEKYRIALARRQH